MTIHARIQERRESLGIDRHTLAALCGVHYESIRLWESPNGTAPTRQRLKLVADQLKTTVEWLTSGISANLENSGRYVFIPRFKDTDWKDGSVHYHHEIGDLDDANDTYAYRRDYLADIGVKAADCRVAILRDDSMALGSQLLVDTSSRRLVSGKVYAFGTSNGVLVRRVILLTNSSVEMQADNPAIRPENYRAGLVPTILGRVVAFQGTLA
jgi:transcriptional regulator with XRE-family HTH domain